jgi:hypothetical protein
VLNRGGSTWTTARSPVEHLYRQYLIQETQHLGKSNFVRTASLQNLTRAFSAIREGESDDLVELGEFDLAANTSAPATKQNPECRRRAQDSE